MPITEETNTFRPVFHGDEYQVEGAITGRINGIPFGFNTRSFHSSSGYVFVLYDPDGYRGDLLTDRKLLHYVIKETGGLIGLGNRITGRFGALRGAWSLGERDETIKFLEQTIGDVQLMERTLRAVIEAEDEGYFSRFTQIVAELESEAEKALSDPEKRRALEERYPQPAEELSQQVTTYFAQRIADADESERAVPGLLDQRVD